jgi:hypothetical protein
MQNCLVTALQIWARQAMQREPDFIIGDNYLRRWWIVPPNMWQNVYLHETLKSDDDRALHDHPWDNISFLIDGCYTEITPKGDFVRKAGDVVQRKAEDSHRLVLPDGGRAVSIFITGPKYREWGFHCPNGWRHWRDFCDATDSGKIGKGCE